MRNRLGYQASDMNVLVGGDDGTPRRWTIEAARVLVFYSGRHHITEHETTEEDARERDVGPEEARCLRVCGGR